MAGVGVHEGTLVLVITTRFLGAGADLVVDPLPSPALAGQCLAAQALETVTCPRFERGADEPLPGQCPRELSQLALMGEDEAKPEPEQRIVEPARLRVISLSKSASLKWPNGVPSFGAGRLLNGFLGWRRLDIFGRSSHRQPLCRYPCIQALISIWSCTPFCRVHDQIEASTRRLSGPRGLSVEACFTRRGAFGKGVCVLAGAGGASASRIAR